MAKTRRANRKGGGYLTDQQMFNPGILPPTSILSAPSTNATAFATRPVLSQTWPTPLLSQGGRRKHRGGGYLSDQQAFNPDVLPPTTLFPAPSTAPTAADIRPILTATTTPHLGGSRRHQRVRGGFSPSVMGSFTANAQAAVVPLALYAAYHTLVPKKGSRRSTRRSARRSARRSSSRRA
jgi:hypothetical protein